MTPDDAEAHIRANHEAALVSNVDLVAQLANTLAGAEAELAVHQREVDRLASVVAALRRAQARLLGTTTNSEPLDKIGRRRSPRWSNVPDVSLRLAFFTHYLKEHGMTRAGVLREALSEHFTYPFTRHIVATDLGHRPEFELVGHGRWRLRPYP